MWAYDGSRRPPFADTPGPGMESVWDYPRPPRLAPDPRRVLVRAGDTVIADSRRAVRVLETASPPTFYLPPDDVDPLRLTPAPGHSHCEWKGRASYWNVLPEHADPLHAVAWNYSHPAANFAALAGWFSFYPAQLHCEVDGERVRPQPGGFYGGWVTREIAGPMKGGPGTGDW